MKRGIFSSMLFKLIALSGLFAILFSCSIQQNSEPAAVSDTPIGVNTYPVKSAVSSYGKLKIVNRQLCSSSGTPVQLKGMSTHGLQWYGNFVTSGAVSTLATDWKATVVRAAMYCDEGGYLTDRSVTNKVIALASYAEANGIYCIIDWHMLNPGDPAAHTSEAVAFFQAMARMYSGKSHIMYEICNEPNGVTWASSIKAYANTVINAIRAIDSSAVIIVGSAEWSQRVDEPAADPLTQANIIYSLHFYSGTHTQWLRDRANAALATIGIFVTEWGTSDASGNGGPYLSEASNWMLWADQNKISWCNWSLCDKAETSAALVSGASVNGGWTDAYITASGKFVRNWMQKAVSSTSSTASSSSRSSVASSVVSSSRSSVASSAVSSSRSSVASSVVSSSRSSVASSAVSSSRSSVASSVSGGYAVNYNISNDWGTGATVTVTMKNNSASALSSWTLVWTFAGTQKITQIWNATQTTSGATVTAKNLSYNGTIGANGGTQSFGFNLSYTGSNAKPTAFTLNGTACTLY